MITLLGELVRQLSVLNKSDDSRFLCMADLRASCSSVGAKAFFVYGFAKSDRDNIRRDELKAFRKLAGEMLVLDDKALAAAMRNETIMEIECHG